MSQIDAYSYSLLGWIECPSSYDFVYMSNSRRLGVYRLEEKADEFNAKKGDILIGGGRGEAEALHIAMPEMVHWLTDELEKVENPEGILHPFWTATFSFMIGEGFSKIGWKPRDERLEVWLAAKVMQDFVLSPIKKSPIEAFKQYLSIYFPSSNLTESFTLGGDYHLRFNLGDELSNSTSNRIGQATKRAGKLFREYFSEEDLEIWLLCYEELEPFFDKSLNRYLPALLKDSLLECYEEIELPCHSGSFEYDENDNSVPRLYEAKLIIAKAKIENLPIEAIFNGIASFEMGKTPCFPQEIYFFQADSDKAFRMYDDRGCYLWANDISKLESFFHSYFEWIPEYHLEEIKNQF